MTVTHYSPNGLAVGAEKKNIVIRPHPSHFPSPPIARFGTKKKTESRILNVCSN